ncbi:MAG: MBL fold metallo-hydrolase [Sulfolobales archaeon]
MSKDLGGVKLIVVVDNSRYIHDLREAWGLSIYVEAYGKRILFDTGPDPSVLQENSEKLNIDLGSIDAVVISHEHRDHSGGLSYVASLKKGIKVYIPKNSSIKRYIEDLGLQPVEVEETNKLFDNIYVTKPLHGPPQEQALAVVTSRGLVALVGCSHPGVNNLVKQAVKDLGRRPYIVIGGFHLAKAPLEKISGIIEELVSLGTSKIYPIHCSGDEVKKYLMKNHPEKYGEGGSGLIIHID